MGGTFIGLAVSRGRSRSIPASDGASRRRWARCRHPGTGIGTADGGGAQDGGGSLTLVVTTAGTGVGIVTSSPASINCGATCAASFDFGTAVTLTATPDANSSFTGWTGGCTGATSCAVTIDQARAVTATFAPKMRTLTVTKAGDGTGTVGLTPGGTNCASYPCTVSIPHGSSVSLAATPGTGSLFDGWSGTACSGAARCAFAITADTSVGATFNKGTRTLTVSFAGGAIGEVLVTPANTRLSADGAVAVTTHQSVTLKATPGANVGFSGWGAPCAGLGDCTITLDADTSVTVNFALPNKAFVTSTQYTPGFLGGLAGADAACAARASAAGLAGTFRAFLGGSAGTAWSRLSGARGWARTDGKPFGDQSSDLQAGRTFYPLILDETGTEIPAGTLVVTGADATAASASSCTDWSSSNGGSYDVTWGDPLSGGRSFAVNGGTACSTANMRLYCFEMTKTVSLHPPVPASARYAFQSTAGGSGLITVTAADGTCQAEATAAGIGGTFKAMMAGNGTTAASRFSSSGATWYRPDNVQLTNTAADMLGGAVAPFAALGISANGLTQEQALVWTGAATVATAGTAASTCMGWTSSSGTTAAVTYGILMGTDWFGRFTSGTCSDLHRFFCFQQ